MPILRECEAVPTWLADSGMLRGWLVAGALCLALAGCGRGKAKTTEQFERRWHMAISSEDHEALFDLLDSASRRRLTHQIEQMRGFSRGAQQEVINQLGGVKLSSLDELTPREYFARLWHKLTQERKPRMQMEATGAESAYMILTMEDGSSQRIRLKIEAGSWTWVMPRPQLGEPGLEEQIKPTP